MPCYGGFYVAPSTWTDWIQSRRSPHPPYNMWNVATAERIIEKVMAEKDIQHLFRVRMVPIPQSEPYESSYGLMAYRRRRPDCQYLPPREDSPADLDGQRMLKDLVGLTASEWRTLWYDGESPNHGCRFVLPSACSDDERQA
ncbi:unnamed protein product [Rhizoctonia solani]|uniref:Uncharacterized protein n=1 Tax=Rhizoctonia solani TaxID=456999 RepID=A0A8H2WWR4_9AGAM|nr:unnamed protein product [Rhizoctonia solani]